MSQHIILSEKTSKLWKRFLFDVTQAQYVVCGEFHGVRENLQIYQYLLSTGVFGGFAYELFNHWQESLRAYAYERRKVPQDIMKLWKSSMIDGKISHEFVSFLDWIRDYRKHRKDFPILFFDASVYPKGHTWNNRDRIMFENLEHERREAKVRFPLLVGTGSLHTRTEAFVMRKEKRYALGYHLRKRKTLFVEFRYQSGTFFNMTKQVFSKSVRLQNPPFLLSKSRKGYVISIQRAHAVQMMTKQV